MPFRRKCGNAEDLARTAKERRRFAPKPLPSARPRCLTPPLPPPPRRPQSTFRFFRKTAEQRTLRQDQSPLFAKLPREVRLRIWHHVLGGGLVHVVRAPGRLRGVTCGEPPDAAGGCGAKPYHPCWGSTRQISLGPTPAFYSHQPSGSRSRHTDLLAPLRTCRLWYAEAVPLLYQDNAFAFDHLDSVVQFSTTVLPSRLNAIRSVALRWNFKYPMYTVAEPVEPCGDLTSPPYDHDTWAQACRVLESIAELRTLFVHLAGASIPLRAAGFEKLVEPLCLIHPKDSYRVVLPAEPPAGVNKERWPFTIEVEHPGF